MNKIQRCIRLLRYLAIVAAAVGVGLFLMVQAPADPCGVNDKKWATASQDYTICVNVDEDSNCGSPQTVTGTNCIPTSANRECLYSSRVYFESLVPGPKKGFAIDVFFAVDLD